jgi:CubicO group peptidase (beta-lactamase class C family)
MTSIRSQILFLSAFVGLSCQSDSQVRPAKTTRPFEHLVLHESAESYAAWPAVARAGDGSIVAVYTESDEHMGPNGRIVGVRSVDDGRTWSDPFVVYDSPLDDRESGITALSDGSLVVHLWSTKHTEESYGRMAPGSYFDETVQAWIETVNSPAYEDAADLQGAHVARSTDGGLTWSDIVRGPDTIHGGVELHDGSLLVASYRHAGDYVILHKADQWDGPWDEVAEVHSPNSDSIRFGEPSILQLQSGRTIMMMRVTPKPYSNVDDRSLLWETFSDDGGLTWADPFPTPLWGFPPHLMALRDGRVVVVYGRRKPPFGQRAAVSYDGVTWTEEAEVTLRDDAPNEDLGYPASLELNDGRVLTVYYQSHASDTLRSLEGPLPGRHKPDILATIWDPGPARERDYGAVSLEMERYVEAGIVAGVVTMVLKDGQSVHEHAAGFRDIESNDPLEVSDLFRIASQTKAITSVATMILIEEGKLALDDPIAKFIPEFANTPVAEETDEGYKLVEMVGEITVRNLLTHTSGISYGWGPAMQAFEEAGILGWYFADRDESIQQAVRKIASLPLTAQPGSDWVYGYSTDVLGAVVEVASGQPLDKYFRERIFDPLGMDDTHFFIPESMSDRLVTVYGITDGRLQRMPDGSVMQSQGDYVNGPRKCFSGGAGLVSTAPDYTRFQSMLLNGGILEGHRIISSETVTKMTTDQVGDLFNRDNDEFGLAFRIYTEQSAGPEPAGTYAWGGAYHSYSWVDRQNGLVAIILTQLIPATGSDIHKQFRKLIYEVERG